MADSVDNAQTRARAAAARNAWAEAYESFASVEAVLGPADLEAFADIAVLCARPERALELYERAFVGFGAIAQPLDAARIAMTIADMHTMGRAKVAAAGWLRKAEQLLADQPECAEHGRLHWAYSMRDQSQDNFDTALEHAVRALAIAENVGDLDGCALALMRKGRVMVKRGDIAEGMALVDEAMIAALGGQLTPMAAGRVYCATIDACHDVFDVSRASEWTDATKRWCDRTSVAGFPGVCRVHRAEILRLRGRWADAQLEAARAGDELREFGALHIVADAHYELGEIHLRLGELDAAAEAFRQAHELGRDPQPGLALLWLEQGQASAAASAIAQAVAELRDNDRLRRARLRPAQVEIAIAIGDLAIAQVAADDLDEIASSIAAPALNAAAAAARAALMLAQGNVAGSIANLRRSILLWNEIDAPYDAAQARVVLAEAYRRQGNDEAGRMELRAARSVFERLGATQALKRSDPGTAAAEPLSATLAASTPPPRSSGDLPSAGDVLDNKIELLRLLGGGGMGVVFEAHHRRTGRYVAVKLLRRDLCADPAACERLLQEALACGRIQHPNVVDVYDAGVHGNSPYIVMELLRGESLGARLERERTLAVGDAVRIVVQALAGLDAAHRAGIIHRDLKPDNLFLATSSAGGAAVVKVVDFGISKVADLGGRLADTQTGAIIGTPYYMSPEQALGSKQIDLRTDIYAVGAVLFHLLTGRPPFVGDNYNALIHAILTTEAPAARSLRPDIPAALETAITRALRFKPEERHATADAFATDLRGATS